MEPLLRERKESLSQSSRTQPDALPPLSPWLLIFFHWIAQRRVSRAFRALRLANGTRMPGQTTANLIAVLNHPSWWDPLVGFVLSERLTQGRNFYAPIDAASLERYRIFRRLGMFPIEMESPRGAAQFLRVGAAVLDAGHVLAVTPQGHFTDVRVRPVQLRPGVATLISRRAAHGFSTTVVPLALEYTFWDQRQPEALVNCGEPFYFPAGQSAAENPSATATQDAVQVRLEEAMARTQDELAALSLRRNPQDFTSLIEGRRGSAGFYGLVERARALVNGNAQRGDHQVASARKRHVESDRKR